MSCVITSTADFDGHDNHDCVNLDGPRHLVDLELEKYNLAAEPDSVARKARSSVCFEPQRPQHEGGDRRHVPRISLRALLTESEDKHAISKEVLPRNRLNHIRSSFKHSFSDVVQRLHNIELTLGNDERTLHELDQMNATMEAYPDAENVLNVYEWTQLETAPMRPPASMPFVREEEQGNISLAAERRELLLCTSQVNFIRWLCGLRPVRLLRHCLTMCELISDVLLPRTHPGNASVRQQEKLADVLGDYMNGYYGDKYGDGEDNGKEGVRAVVLQGDGSLLSAVEQGIIGYNPGKDTLHHGDHLHKKSRSALAKELANNVAKHGKENAGRTHRNKMRGRHDGHVTGPGGVILQPLHNFTKLPEKLEPFALFWELQEDGPSKEKDRRRTVKSTKHAERKSTIQASDTQLQSMTNRAVDVNGAKCMPAFWGDKDGMLSFRRYLLNPALTIFAASRQHDTCVFWTGSLGRVDLSVADTEDTDENPRDGERLQRKRPLDSRTSFFKKMSSRHDISASGSKPTSAASGTKPEKQMIDISAEAVCFPPPGYVPLEILNDETRAHWTIMPDSKRFQPTQKIQVRIWRVRIQTCDEGSKRTRIFGQNAKSDDEWTAERLEEVPVSELKIDCSSLGNPFCIIFRPEVDRLKDGDQFEVVLSGLCGEFQELAFFHHFCAMRQPLIDDHLIEEVSKLRIVLTNPILWQEVQTYHPAAKTDADSRRERFASARSASRKSMFQSNASQASTAPDTQHTPNGVISTARIGLISHPDLEIHTDFPDLIITLSCEKARALIPSLYLARSSGIEHVSRAAQVTRLGDIFIVRVKIPMKSARYELHFLVCPRSAPENAIPHSLKYIIQTSDICHNLLPSLQHPLLQKYGFAPVLPTAQLNQISLISPVNYRVSVGQVYFLLHAPVPDTHEEDTAISWSSLVKSAKNKNSACSLFSSRLRRSVRGQVMNWAADLHEPLAAKIGEHCQDTVGEMHFDVSVGGRYVLRLKQRHDFPELYESLLQFRERDAGSKVEVFLRQPKKRSEDYAPQKLCEWIICSAETLPTGWS
jgi:hypothetical protein